MSVGEGESLVSLASLMGIEESQRSLFYSEAKANFGSIFGSQEVAAALNSVLAANAALSKYSVVG